MADFKDLSKEKISDRENELLKYWKDIDLLHESVNSRDSEKSYVFYEGPPTANAKPGIHHVMSRTLKDMTCRYKTMKGYQVKRKAGWDTHGLPVEIEIEKKLGLNDKKEIEEYGIKKFNEACRDSVFQYEKLWRSMTERMAYLIDLDNPYITLDNNYIETVWWILDKMFKDGLIYEGHKILPYCPRCGTGLASHEVAQGYEEINTVTAYVKFKKADEDAYFLAWTTTPWTLPSNVSLTVNPDINYVKVKCKGEVYYLAENMAKTVLEEEYEIIDRMKGKDMEFWEYEQLIPFLKPDKKAFFITCRDYVTVDDGTGIVHTAPAFGEDDYNTGKLYDLPVLQPVSEEGKFLSTPWTGKSVVEADPEIIKWLAENGKLFRKQKMLHNYPHCWRCHTPLLYYAKPSWYIEVTKFKDKLIENNNGVNWFPEFVGKRRFGNWLENLQDWALSRSRYWGTPLNIWRCEECGHTISIGSRNELKEKAIEEISSDIELHRPYVDDVHIECEHCKGKMTRVKDVIDVWFDSGSMPFAQHHYPFENAERFDELFPADFINEGIDQTRGWFYSLLAIATYVKGVSPYKNVLVNDLVLDKSGKKMSKSKGNTLNPFDLFEKYGADAVRWYIVTVSPPWTPMKFNEEDLAQVESKFFRSIRNVYNFFSLYANTDGIDPREFEVPYEKLEEMDKWIISRYNSVLKTVCENMDRFEYTKAFRDIQEFVVEDLSNWYIRRCRRRFWKTTVDDDKRAVYRTTYDILCGICKMIAPVAPFTAEELFIALQAGNTKSVHLELYPEADDKFINDELEGKMQLVRTLVTLGRASREKEKLKVRQPLSEAIVDGKYERVLENLVDVIKEELNVKEVVFEKDLSMYMDYSLKPNFKEAGPVLGPKIKDFSKALASADARELVREISENVSLKLDLSGEFMDIPQEFVLTQIIAKDGFDVMMENGLFIILDTKLTGDLIVEGYIREFISKIQQMRKQSDFEVTDRIKIEYASSDELDIAIKSGIEHISQETLADEIVRVDSLVSEEIEINDLKAKIKVSRV